MAVYEESQRDEAPADAGADAAAYDERLIGQLIRFEHYVMKSCQVDVFAHMAELDLSITQLRLLFLLDSMGKEQAVHELAAGLSLSVAATGRAVDVLAKLGLVSRREDELDRRVKRITVTQAGRDAMGELAAARREGLLRMVAFLQGDERAQLSDALTRVLSHSEVIEFEAEHPIEACEPAAPRR